MLNFLTFQRLEICRYGLCVLFPGILLSVYNELAIFQCVDKINYIELCVYP